MARSSYVYVVMDHDKPVAGFTVKHELKTWLDRNLDERTASEYKVWRLSDGLYQREPVEMTDL